MIPTGGAFVFYPTWNADSACVQGAFSSSFFFSLKYFRKNQLRCKARRSSLKVAALVSRLSLIHIFIGKTMELPLGAAGTYFLHLTLSNGEQFHHKLSVQP